MILNVGCGGRSNDEACFLGDVRIDVKRFPSVMFLMDAHFLGFKDSAFEKILCFEVLEHLESPIKALKEFKRVLKEDGRVLISVPNVWYWRRIRKTKIKKYTSCQDPEELATEHKQAWDIHEFNNLACCVGLKITAVKWLDWYPQGKRKLSIMESLLRFMPQICYTHIMFKLNNMKMETSYVRNKNC